jgi:23S rRNA pseudouridine1911/1915/1917 synthase
MRSPAIEEDPESDDLDAQALADAVHRFVVDIPGDGLRLDKYLAGQLPALSRSRIQRWIEDGAVRLNDVPARVRTIVHADDRIEVQERSLPESLAFVPEPMPIPIVWEDDTIIVIDKPAGLVVHPGAGNWSGTLLNGLLAYDPKLAAVPRAGIVHRLDAGTSGLMVVARTVAAQLDLVRQLQARSVVREYWALVAGAVAPSATIDAAIGRDPRNPLRFRVSQAASARPARTFVRRLAEWKSQDPAAVISWIACRLDTGRTHQIRVHLESIGHPLIGDPVYRRHLPASLAAHPLLARPALHACRLELIHPQRREPMSWFRLPPADMLDLLRRLGARESQLRAPEPSAVALDTETGS